MLFSHNTVDMTSFIFSTVCGLIEKLSLSKMPFKSDPVISKLILFCYYGFKCLYFIQHLN